MERFKDTDGALLPVPTDVGFGLGWMAVVAVYLLTMYAALLGGYSAAWNEQEARYAGEVPPPCSAGYDTATTGGRWQFLDVQDEKITGGQLMHLELRVCR
jgi:hypothetical protein